jgi:preprotein translocase subunit SecE
MSEQTKERILMVLTYAAFSVLIYWMVGVGFDQPV